MFPTLPMAIVCSGVGAIDDCLLDTPVSTGFKSDPRFDGADWPFDGMVDES
jgi:hypothetical protein